MCAGRMMAIRGGQRILVAALVLAALAATVACVPTSVLAQNTEMLSANGGGRNSALLAEDALHKVKRSSATAKREAAGSSSSTIVPPAVSLDKKSSPEIVPASFNAPPSRAADPQPLDAEPVDASPADINLLSTALAAGLTAAAVEAAAVAAVANQREQAAAEDGARPMLYKRGIPSQQQQQYLLDNYRRDGYHPDYYYNHNPYVQAQAGAPPAGMPESMWADEADVGSPAYGPYADAQDPDSYVTIQRAPLTAASRGKAYDNLQSILNSEAYLEPVVLPMQYAVRAGYYGNLDGEPTKRTFKLNKFGDGRLKRDSTKLTPADMLALVALVEAGERARQENEVAVASSAAAANASPEIGYPTLYAADAEPEAGPLNYGPVNYGSAVFDYPNPFDELPTDYNTASWLDQPLLQQRLQQQQQQQAMPAVMDYYGLPLNLDVQPKYELARGNHYGSGKRFMVSKKKKRSVGQQGLSFTPNTEQFF